MMYHKWDTSIATGAFCIVVQLPVDLDLVSIYR